MSSPTHKAVLKEKLIHAMAINPLALEIVTQISSQFLNGFWSTPYIDFALQHRDLDDYTLLDAWGFARFHALLWTGKLLIADLLVHTTPDGDGAKSNSEVISDLPEPFLGECWGGLSGNDGYIRWTQPIEMEWHAENGQTGRQIVRPRSVPLEIGCTEISRTLLHVGAELGLARWPYESETIRLFVVPDSDIVDWLPKSDHIPRSLRTRQLSFTPDIA